MTCDSSPVRAMLRIGSEGEIQERLGLAEHDGWNEEASFYEIKGAQVNTSYARCSLACRLVLAWL